MAVQIPSENWRDQLRRGITDLWFILSISLALFILIVLLGYHNTDPGWSTSGADGIVKHWLGHFGAYISDALFSLFGYAAYFLPLGLLTIGWYSAKRLYFDPELIAWKIFALSFSLIALAGIFSLHWGVNINSLAVTAGGVIGQKLNVELLKVFSVSLVMIIFTFFFLLGLTLLMEVRWLKSLERIGIWVTRIWEAVTPERNDGVADKVRIPVRESKETISKRRRQLAQRIKTDIHDQRLAVPTEQDPLLRAQPSFSLSLARDEPSFSMLNDDNLPPPIPTAAEVIKTPVQPTTNEDISSPTPTHTLSQPMSTTFAEDKVKVSPVLSWEKYQEVYGAEVFAEKDQTKQEEQELPTPLQPTPSPQAEAIIFPPPAPNPPQQDRLRVHLHSQTQPAIGQYALPPLDLLNLGSKPVADYSAQELDEMAMRLENALKNYKLSAKVENISVGPVVTRFELSLAAGVKVSSLNNLEKDIARSLAVPSVRVVDVIPNKPFVGLEMPNRKRQVVSVRNVLAESVFEQAKSPLTMALGVDVEGEAVICDLGKMPHLLVAGTTGSGKSVGINVMLASMLFKARPDELRLILIDPKMLEMTMYGDIPHLLTPVITDMMAAENALCWAVAEMERRYQVLAAMKVRKTEEFNKIILAAEKRGEKIANPFYQAGTTLPPYLEKMPYIVIVIDEMADLMMVAGKNVEQLIARIAQKARAAGIHLILATQRPSVDVITGLIKANIPSRIAFQVSAKVDSRIILDTHGAENLLGAGDMLYAPAGTHEPQRVHGAFISDQEVDRLTTYLREQGKPEYEASITTPIDIAGGNVAER